MNNPFLRRNQPAHGTKSEVRIAKSLGARLQPASGALRSAKSDAKLQRGELKFRFESKSTIAATLSLDSGWLNKIAYEASTDGSIPVLTVSFVTPDGKPRLPRNSDWVCLPKVFFDEMMESLP